LIIGDYNLFEVGCRIESPSIGSYNVFEPKARVTYSTAVGSECHISSGVVVLPRYPLPNELEEINDETLDDTAEGKEMKKIEIEKLEDRTTVFMVGEDIIRRKWNGEGHGQQRAMHVKHLEYLKEVRL
jgi:dynactin 6